jgi:hypothetical protein
MTEGSEQFKSLAQAPLETQGVDLNRNFGVSFASSAGHPDFTEDKWIAKADRKKANKDDDESLMQIREEDEQTDEQKEAS